MRAKIYILELDDDPECQNPVVISLNVIPRQHHRRDPEGEVWFGNQGLTGLHCLVGSCVLGAHAHEHYDVEMVVITMVVMIMANFGNLFPWPCTGLK